MNPKDLHDFMDSERFSQNIEAPVVDMKHGELFIAIFKYCCDNSLTFTARVNLFKVINSMFCYPILPDTEYVLNKIISPKKDAKFHAVCHHCCTYLGEFGVMNAVDVCPNCSQKVRTKNASDSSFFAVIDPSEQIADLLHIHENYYDYVVKERAHETGYISDVYDGKKYREFLSNLPEVDKFNYATAMMNTDGAPKFKSSKVSIWPIYLIINELPVQVRLNKPVTCALWIGKTKPEMSVFLDKFVDMINELTEKGFQCKIKNEDRNVKLFILKCILDTMARGPAQGLKQFNAYYGCAWCLQRGVHDGSMRYALSKNV